MRQALLLLIAVIGVLAVGQEALGYWKTYEVVYGAISMMAVMISGTFLWLWVLRATPLALGMAFSWAGCASVLGWWWFYRAFDEPAAMQANGTLFVFLSFYFVGATLHFATIQRSLGLHGQVFLVPVLGSVVLAYLFKIWF